jgi:hypothetical protein
MIHLDEDRMRLTQPFLATVLNKPYRFDDEFRFIFDEPFDLSQVAFKRKSAGQINLI